MLRHVKISQFTIKKFLNFATCHNMPKFCETKYFIFRNTLNLGPNAELFVGHTPLTRHDTLWSHVGGIAHHDVVFSGNFPWVGLFTRVGRHMIPLRYRSEPLLPVINDLVEQE